MRQYYLTPHTYCGNQANGAGVCAAGFHFASLWEILQTATLSYNTTLGQTFADSGQGPPDNNGWVRTGNVSGSSTTAGAANCNNWTATMGYYGTVARPSDDWTPAQATFQGWVVQAVQLCYPGAPVWCVEDIAAAPTPTSTPAVTAAPTSAATDAPGRNVYLPLVLG